MELTKAMTEVIQLSPTLHVALLRDGGFYAYAAVPKWKREFAAYNAGLSLETPGVAVAIGPTMQDRFSIPGCSDGPNRYIEDGRFEQNVHDSQSLEPVIYAHTAMSNKDAKLLRKFVEDEFAQDVHAGEVLGRDLLSLLRVAGLRETTTLADRSQNAFGIALGLAVACASPIGYAVGKVLRSPSLSGMSRETMSPSFVRELLNPQHQRKRFGFTSTEHVLAEPPSGAYLRMQSQGGLDDLLFPRFGIGDVELCSVGFCQYAPQPLDQTEKIHYLQISDGAFAELSREAHHVRSVHDAADDRRRAFKSADHLAYARTLDLIR